MIEDIWMDLFWLGISRNYSNSLVAGLYKVMMMMIMMIMIVLSRN